MRKLGYVLALLIICGCGVPDILQRERRPPDPASRSAENQYQAAERAFQEKLAAASGLTLSELRARWGQVHQNITQNKLTIYNWVRNLTVTPPPEAAAKLGLADAYAETDTPAEADQTMTLSCMAVFIIQGGVVVEAFSEGRCLDPGLMPAWRPVVEAKVPGQVG
jgi:hypothetical protein